MAEQFLHLAGLIKTDSGQVTLHMGDPVPAGADKDELARLRANGSFGEAPSDEPEVRASDLVAADEGTLAEFVASSTAKEVVDAAGNDPELAQRLLNAEQDGKDRKTAVEGLEAVIDGDE